MARSVILERLEAAEQLLSASRGTPQHATVSHGQSSLILSLLRQRQLRAADLGMLGERIGRCAWASSEARDSLLEALGTALQRQPASRAKQQSFEYLLCYFTESHWKVFMGPDVDYAAKLNFLANQVVSLGLRNPSEATCAKATGLLLICMQGLAKARSMGTGHLRYFYLHVKPALKPKSSATPLRYVEVLSLMSRSSSICTCALTTRCFRQSCLLEAKSQWRT